MILGAGEQETRYWRMKFFLRGVHIAFRGIAFKNASSVALC